MLNIVFFTHYNSMNGANQSLLTLLVFLKDKINIEKVIIYGKDNGKEGLHERLKEIGIKSEKIDLKYYLYYSNKYYGFFSIPLKVIHNIPRWRFLYKDLKNKNIDLIYSNSSLENTGILLSKILKIKHFWHIREFGFADYNYRHIGGDYLKRIILNKSNQLIAISKSIEEHIKIPDKTKLIFNGIFSLNELSQLRPKKKVKGLFRLGMVGVIAPVKNQKECIQSISILSKEHDNIVLNIYGNVVDVNYHQELEKMIVENSIEDKVNFFGFVTDKNRIYENIDVLLMCSHNEAFGRVTIEAMAYGIPVIGYNNAGTAELITNGVDGFLYDHNKNRLNDLILDLLSDENRYNQISENAKLKANKYSVEIYGNKILKLMNTINIV